MQVAASMDDFDLRLDVPIISKRSSGRASAPLDGDAYDSMPVVVRRPKKKETTFLKDIDEDEGVLPRPLPKGITYVSNFATYDDMMDRQILQVDEDEKVHLSVEEVLAIYRAKCEDQGLLVTWQRESRFMELISRNCKGLHFSLRENGLGYLSAQCIAQVLAQNQYYAMLDLSGNRLRDIGAEWIAELLVNNATLVHVVMKSNDIGHIGGEALARALEYNCTLTSLDLSGISGINRNHLGTKGAYALGQALKVNKCLYSLNLGSNGLGKEGVDLLTQGLVANTTLAELDISSNNLGWEGAQILSAALEVCNIRTVNLERNYIGDKGMTILSNIFKSQTKIAIEEMNISTNNIRAAGVKALAAVMIEYPKALQLHSLKADGNEIGDEGLEELTKAFRETKTNTLTSLSLAKTELGADSAQFISDILTKDLPLQKLELADNTIGNQGIAALCQALKKEKAPVTFLDVSNNRISDKGGLELASMIKVNSSLQTLNLRQNTIKMAGERFADGLKSNQSILNLDLTYNDFSYKAFSSIEHSLARNAKNFKDSTGQRLLKQIHVAQRDENLLYLTQTSIEEEHKQREMAREKVKQKREALKKTISGLSKNVEIMEEELRQKQEEKAKEDGINHEMSQEVSKAKSKLDKQISQLTKKIEEQQERTTALNKAIQKNNKAIQTMMDQEEQFLAPLVEKMKHEKTLRDAAEDEAKWEKNKVEEWEKKLAEAKKAKERAAVEEKEEPSEEKKELPGEKGKGAKKGKGKGKK